jgi:hypothetical protein
MPLDIVTPPISSSIARQDRWQPRISRAEQPADTAAAGLAFEAGKTAETPGVRSQPSDGSIAFLAQTLAQAGAGRLRAQAPVAAAKATQIAQRYELAESRDPILRSEPILFRVKA